jgi:hypothetical protein
MFQWYERMQAWATRSNRNLFIVSTLWFTFFLLAGLWLMVLMVNYCEGFECTHEAPYELPLGPQG